MNRELDLLSGHLLDDDTLISLAELSRACAMHAEWLSQLVEEGILEPHSDNQGHWRFSASCLRRARTVRRLQHDLGVNLAGAALALDLLDQIDLLQARIRLLERDY